MMLWRFEHARSSLPWPETLPQPPKELKQQKQGVYKHVLASEYEATARALVDRCAGTTAVEVRNGKWSVGVRPVLPEEAVVHRARALAYETKRR